MTPVAGYLEELSRLLDRGARRRVLAEVDAHLAEAVAAGRARGEDADAAERHAVERFGAPADVARQFNGVRRRRGPTAIVRRGAAVLLASSAAASLGTATVWALEPGAGHHHRPAVHQRLHHGHRR